MPKRKKKSTVCLNKKHLISHLLFCLIFIIVNEIKMPLSIASKTSLCVLINLRVSWFVQ